MNITFAGKGAKMQKQINNKNENAPEDVFDINDGGRMATYGVSWCESGIDNDGEKTNICGLCKYNNIDDCYLVLDEYNLCGKRTRI